MMNTPFGSLVNDERLMGRFATNLDAIEAIQATQRTVAECLPGPLANELAMHLPESLAKSVRCENWKAGEGLSNVEFASRVALREGASVECAREDAQLTLFRILRALPDDLMSRVRCELPDDFAAALTQEPPLVEAHMHQPIA